MKRIVFPPDKQRELIDSTRKLTCVSLSKLAVKLDVSKSLLFAYRADKYRLPYSLFEKLCNLVSVRPEELQKIYGGSVVEWSSTDNLPKKSKIGSARNKFLPEPTISFSKTNLDLDVSSVEFNKKDAERKLRLPTKITPLLAQEVGMHLGDGFLSNRRPDYRLRGGKDEKEFYDGFVKQLYKDLFNLDINIKEFEESYGFEVYSKALSIFKTRILGIQLSPKTNIRIPEIFKVNNQKILSSLLRGYFDTDGCLVVYSKYGYKKYYPVITAASASKPLIMDVLELLQMLGFKCCYSVNHKKNRPYYQVQLYGYANFEKFRELIGWSNPKYLKKAQILTENLTKLKAAWVV